MTDKTCVNCSNPATHTHTITNELLCCGHASQDIDAVPIRANHKCEKVYTIEQHSRELECEHRDNLNPPTGSLIPCHETAKWEITRNLPGAPTRSRYCPEHYLERLQEIMEKSTEDKLEVHLHD